MMQFVFELIKEYTAVLKYRLCVLFAHFIAQMPALPKHFAPRYYTFFLVVCRIIRNRRGEHCVIISLYKCYPDLQSTDTDFKYV